MAFAYSRAEQETYNIHIVWGLGNGPYKAVDGGVVIWGEVCMTEASCSNVMMYRDVQIGCTSSDLLKNNIHILVYSEMSFLPIHFAYPK